MQGMNFLFRLPLLSLCLASFPVAVSGGETTALFAEEDRLHTVLTAPLSQAYKQKSLEQRLYMDGKWSYKLDDGTTKRLELKIRTRGNFRRHNCTLPPLRLNFRKKALADTIYDGQNKLKMVSPCQAGDRYQQLIMVEYLSYRLFELLSDYHFKVRLVDVGYADTDQGLKPWSSTNFLIEDVKDMAGRYDLKEQKIEQPDRQNFDLGQSAIVELFQYMIGNTDYSTLLGANGDNCCHNARLLAEGESGKNLLPVAYDFDSTGLVNAPYALPPANLPIKRVRVRYFTGWCKQEHHYQAAIERFVERKDAALALFSESDLLDERTRKSTVGYLEDFYKVIENPKKVQKKILDRCRGEVIVDAADSA